MFFEKIKSKIKSWEQAAEQVSSWKSGGDRIVFTNGCFDLLHIGHVHYLAGAKDLGQRLVVGVNSDESVRRLKGPQRPIQAEPSRMYVLASLACVDLVVLFKEDTPYELIKNLLPDVLVKGGDWQPAQIIGSDIVLAAGGQVRSLPYLEGFSTTNIEVKIRKG
ncbi:MAG: D-glycero-beta-D-manno-heptose 1-phosphate adenylyltransferase [Lewinellaceae bacterium]|nr:D-glycero-beta-D-manno-heptose 1-phosphate adenylyltransferase [Saprospiraceae bacterium]MCB9336736.1 D-glycero-beta-D-manno-heptose 1-phosphate adenylyltransferase [Lewinellaceae bacterium]